jgi:serine/threonine protein kinase
MIRILGGRYRLGDTLGGGGTAVVYRARDVVTRTDVAIKELRPQFAGQSATRQRFVHEAEVARSLAHPAIVRILDADPGDRDGRPFLVMELVPGETLRVLLGRLGGLGEAAARRIGAALAEALDHAHGRGVIHGDLKPENVFVVGVDGADRSSLAVDESLGGRIRLGDFGHARVTSLASLSGTSMAWGTPEYMAPEAFARGRMDPRSDLYSLGVLLHELVTGRLPWTRTQALTRVTMAITGARPPLAPTGASAGIDQLLVDLLAPSPSDRPESGAAVLARLQGGGQTVLAPAVECMACGASMRSELPICLGCGRAMRRFVHTQGEPWRLVLRNLDDDAVLMTRLLNLLATVARPTSAPISFLIGDLTLYSREERKSRLPLPVVLFSDLDRATAHELERLFRSRGVDVEARTGSGGHGRDAALTAGWLASTVGGVGGAFYTALEFGGVLAWMVAVGALTVATGGAALLVGRRRHQTRRGAFALLDKTVAVPLADQMLADLAATLQRLRAPEARALLVDLISVLYCLTQRAAGGPPSELGQSIADLAGSVARRTAATAERLDALDAELDRASDAGIVQELGRLERRLGHASDAEREALAATRRELEAALDRRHQLEREHERLSSALCILLGRLRDAARHAESHLALVEEEALALEAAAVELDAFLSSSHRPRPTDLSIPPRPGSSLVDSRALDRTGRARP